jgi:hypothetical protein
MARKATDLLDVFRFSDDGGDDDSHSDRGRGASKARKPKKKETAKPRQRVQGLILNRRQIVLGSSAIALLLVLSFVLGLSTGRSGPATQPTKIERRTATRFAIRGSLPLLDKATQKAIEPKAVAAILKRDYGLDRDHLQLGKADGRLIIDVGPFRSERAAREWLESSNLEMLHLFMEDPFRWPEYVPWRARR